MVCHSFCCGLVSNIIIALCSDKARAIAHNSDGISGDIFIQILRISANKRYENLTAVMCDEKIPDGMKNKILRSFVDKIVYDKHEKSLDFYYYF